MGPKFTVFLLAAAVGLLFILNVWGYDLWPADEPRFAQVAREMMQTGEYLAPHINGLPYKEKPPLLFWSIVAASQPFGDVTELSARLPSVVAAVVTVVLTFLLATRLYGRRVGVWSAIILATSNLFWWEARSVRTDMLLTAFMTASLYAFWRWHESKRAPWLFAFYGAMAAGLLTKGPPALIFPLLLLVFFYWKRTEERRATHWVIGTLAAIAVVLAWFIPARLGLNDATAGPGMQGEFLRMTLGRLLGESKFQWPWYYLLNVPAGLLPWSLFLPWAIAFVWRNRREEGGGARMRLLLGWMAPSFIFFSICFGKRGVYLLPLYPVLAILLSRSVLELMDGERAATRKRIAYVWGVALIVLGLAPPVPALTQYPELVTQGTVIFSLCAAGFGFAAIVGAARNASRNLHAAVAVQSAMLCMLAAVGVFPTLDAFKGASDICAPLRGMSEKGVDYRLYTLGFSREEYIFYSKHFHTPVLTDLLKIDVPQLGLADMAKQQRSLRKAVVKAVEDVPLADLVAPTQAELQALRDAVHAGIAGAKPDPQLIVAFETALAGAVAEFSAQFDQDTPAFLFVQEQDWKWLVALFPDFRQHVLIRRESVGRRDMLLVANETGGRMSVAGETP